MNLSINNRYDPKIRLNSICPYFTMFPLDFPYSVLKNANSNSWILDPFCGRGTTNFAARLRGLKNVGIDSNSVACAVAQSKLIKVDYEKVYDLAKEVIHDIKDYDLPSNNFWELAYHEKTLIEISKIRSYLNNKEKLSEKDIALRAIMLGILHGPKMKTQHSYLSNQMPRTFSTKPEYSLKYWKKNKLNPERVLTLKLIKTKAKYIFNNEIPKKVDSRIIKGDSRSNFDDKIDVKFDYVITSPPYFGMSTYEQDQWLRKWFLGGPETVSYTSKKQIKHGSEKIFIEDLSKVWKQTAKVCCSNAKLIIRFGALPSLADRTPSDIIKDSISFANTGWEIKTIKNAGKPNKSQRQASQFMNSTKSYIEEIDVYAHLNQ
jgi:DNA modification methylase